MNFSYLFVFQHYKDNNYLGIMLTFFAFSYIELTLISEKM